MISSVNQTIAVATASTIAPRLASDQPSELMFVPFSAHQNEPHTVTDTTAIPASISHIVPGLRLAGTPTPSSRARRHKAVRPNTYNNTPTVNTNGRYHTNAAKL